MLRAILKTEFGDVVAKKEMVAVVRFPQLVMLDSHLYFLSTVNLKDNEAIYTRVDYYLFAPTPIEE